MEKKRIEWVDTARFLCMLCIMADHSEYTTDRLDSFIIPFVLNVFTFAAGYVYTHRPGFGRFLRKKIQQLFLPWLLLSVLNLLLTALFSSRREVALLDALLKNLMQVHYNGDEMWYVAALFVAFLPFYFLVGRIERSPRKGVCGLRLTAASFALAVVSDCFVELCPPDRLIWSVGCAKAALPWHLEAVGNLLFFMLLGYQFRRYAEARFDHLNRPWLWPALLALYYGIDMVLPLRVGGIFGVPRVFFQFFCALLGVCMVIALSKKLPASRYTRAVGQNTILYYGLHGKAETVLQRPLLRLPFFAALHWSNHPFSAVVAAALSMLVSVLLLPVVWFISRYLPVLAGKGRRKKA